MKAIILTISVLILVIAGYYIFTQIGGLLSIAPSLSGNATSSASSAVRATYYCKEGTIQAEYGAGNVSLMLSDGQSMTLPHAVSGSGVRYAAGNTTFWNKGDNAFLTEATTTIYSGCVAGTEKVVSQTNALFTDSSKTFRFAFPFQFVLSGGDGSYSQEWRANTNTLGLLRAAVIIPRGFLPKTNFSEAKFSVGVSADPHAISGCLASEYGSMEQQSQVSINGVSFTKFEFTDAGAGNFYETTSYHALRAGECIVVEYTIHSTNIQNYSPDQGITAFDHAKVQSILEGIVQSFTFL